MKLDISKPIFLCSHGPSISELEEWIDKYRDLDVYWASFNRFDTLQPILNKINKHFNIIYIMNVHRIYQTIKPLKRFLNKGGARVLLVNTFKYSPLNDKIDTDFKFIKKYTKNIKYTSEHIDSNVLINFISCLYKLGFRRFCVFGLDGTSDCHYKQEKYENTEEENTNFINGIEDERDKLNELGIKILGEDIEDIEILNCNELSKIDCFNKISYSNVVSLFK